MATTTSHGQVIGQLATNQSAVLVKIEAGGSLEARRLRSGATMFYWRRTRDSRTDRIPIGTYDASAPPKSLKPTGRGYSVAAAQEAARELAKHDRETPGGIRAERARREAEKAAADRATAERERFTLGALCELYADWLEQQEKPAHRDVRNIFKNHLEGAFPHLWNTPAAQVDRRQIIEPIRRLVEAGKPTTARKARSYLRSAYACALRADSDAALPSAFIGFTVTANPVESVVAIRAGGPDKNPLPLADLRSYWKALKDEPGVVGAALRLHLLSGAQRVAQVARLRREHVHGDWLQLFDPKGRRSQPRPHLVPITKAMQRELEQLPRQGFVLSTDGGKTSMHPTSISAWAADVGERAGIEGFMLKRCRSAVETELARLGIPLHVRAQLQSHGLAGVQQRAYDAHTYQDEKRHALEALNRLLEQSDVRNITPIRRKRA